MVYAAAMEELEEPMLMAGDAVATEARPAKRAAVEYFILILLVGIALNEGWQVVIIIRRRTTNTDDEIKERCCDDEERKRERDRRWGGAKLYCENRTPYSGESNLVYRCPISYPSSR